MRQHGVIFDMDGVLIDSGEAHYQAFVEMGRRLGRPFSRELFHALCGFHNNQIFPRWLEREIPQPELQRYADEKEALYRERMPAFVKLMPGAKELVRAVREAGFRVAVGSSGPRANVALALRLLAEPFEIVITGDEVAHGKPDPTIFLLAAAGLDVEPDCCVVIEDALAGIEAAHRAGMKVCAVPTTLPASALGGAHRVFPDLASITPASLRELLEA